MAGQEETEKKENALVRYFRDTRAELRKVRWPSRSEAWSLTKIVLAVTLGMAVFLGHWTFFSVGCSVESSIRISCTLPWQAWWSSRSPSARSDRTG